LDVPSEGKPKSQLGRSSSTSSNNSKESMYYDIQCRDNGCGIVADEIGELLGRVLSGSKHGIRQTRGKFGLGAKMALIWSKKSSGLPIQIRSAHCTDPAGEAESVDIVVLDMDIQRNLPKILSRRRCSPSEAAGEEATPGGPWRRGLDMRITIGGSWSSCRSRVLQYFQQLAVITPYAQLSLVFESLKDPKKNFNADFVRR
jgi:DNA topoisomerase VI subunit B